MTTQLEPTVSPPLYVRGRRRAGPSRWGYDPDAPTLLPARPVDFKKPPPEYIGEAYEFVTSTNTFVHRRRELGDLRKRSRRTAGRTVIFIPGYSEGGSLSDLRKPRGDHRARLQSFLGSLIQHARAVSPQHDLVGIWNAYVDPKGQKRVAFVRPFSRHELAAMAGVPVKQVDVMIREGKNAGYIARRQRRRKKFDDSGRLVKYEGDLASLLLTEHFYRSCGPGAWRRRSKHLGLFKRPPANDAQAEQELAEAKVEPWTPPEARGWGKPPDDEGPPEPTS